MKGYDMARRTACTLIVVLLAGLVTLTACQSQNSPNAAPSDRQSRLMGDENARLREQLANLPNYSQENARLKAENTELKSVKRKLDSCTAELATVKEENATMQKKADETVNFAMTTVLAEAKKDCNDVRAENQKLKAQIESLKAQSPAK